MKMKSYLLYGTLLIGLVLLSCNVKKRSGTKDADLRLENRPQDKRVDVYFGDNLFTSYIYPDNIKKSCLWPVVTSEGTEITRGYPLKKAPGESFDHPHQVGIWMTYGDVNGIDYWGNSDSIAVDQKYRYGIIRNHEIVAVQSDKGTGKLTARADWDGGGRTQINEEMTFYFIDRGSIRIIDRISTLTAREDILFKDNKEGMFAIRVSRELEMPSKTPVTLTDSYGNPTVIKVIDNELVSGDYLSSEGKTGADVWGTRAKWMKLFGKYKDEDVAVIIIDHKRNPGYPTYWHARGYGLFSANPLGQKEFSGGKEELNLSLKKGESTRFAFRTVICSGKITEDEINRLADEFSKEY